LTNKPALNDQKEKMKFRRRTTYFPLIGWMGDVGWR